MKKSTTILTGLFFFTTSIIISCVARRSEPLVGRTFVAKNIHVLNGQQVFMKNCQKCHPGGETGLGPALNNKPAPGFLKKFQVRHGLGAMPSFKQDEIAKQDLKDIALYLKALKHY